MDDKTATAIQAQIDFLKADLDCKYPDTALGAAKMVEAREATKRQILKLMNRLAGIEPLQDDMQYYRDMLERIANDNASLNMAKEAIAEMDDDDCKADLIKDVCAMHEATKKEIAAKLIEKLG